MTLYSKYRVCRTSSLARVPDYRGFGLERFHCYSITLVDLHSLTIHNIICLAHCIHLLA